jgi:glycosyltransferase involved in cell wall biosynthesis
MAVEPAPQRPIPRVSIVIPTYNAERYLGATLDGVLAQTFDDWELVVYDDGSTDATRDLARRYADRDPRIRVAEGANGGVAAARNEGYALTDKRSAFVIYLDNDDVWEPDALETLVDVLDAHPEYAASHSLARCIDEHGRPTIDDDLEERLRERTGFRGGRQVALETRDPTTFADLAYHNWVTTPGTQLTRREVIELIGGFDGETTPADDWDMAIRVSRSGDIGYVDRPLLLWRRHADAQSFASPHYGRAHLRVRKKMLTDPSNTPDQLRSARQGFRHICRSTLREAWQAVAERDVRRSIRQTGKALQQYFVYMCADVPVRLRRRFRAR